MGAFASADAPFAFSGAESWGNRRVLDSPVDGAALSGAYFRPGEPKGGPKCKQACRSTVEHANFLRLIALQKREGGCRTSKEDSGANRVQLTTGGHRVYLGAAESAFGSAIDNAMLVRMYGVGRQESEARYSPADCIGCRTIPISGNPKTRDISTSYVERQNLTMRIQMRRFTRLTNGFSKKIENHGDAIALHYMYYNFCRAHQTLRVTPAMEAGITDHA